jgi:hypothetical protein
MTEEQAHLTRCCGPEGCGGNSSGGRERFCLASHCMAWRWIPKAGVGPDGPNYYGGNWQGYCGLAGKP